MTSLSDRSAIPGAALALGLGGLIPFFVTALSQWSDIPQLGAEAGFRAGITYAAVIVSFLGGIRWGATMQSPSNRHQSAELAGSVVASLVGWASLLLSPLLGLCLLVAGFLLQALWDILSVEKNRLPPWFGKLRMVLTVGAVLALSSMLVKLTIS
jgi:hypothetical protein